MCLISRQIDGGLGPVAAGFRMQMRAFFGELGTYMGTFSMCMFCVHALRMVTVRVCNQPAINLPIFTFSAMPGSLAMAADWSSRSTCV